MGSGESWSPAFIGALISGPPVSARAFSFVRGPFSRTLGETKGLNGSRGTIHRSAYTLRRVERTVCEVSLQLLGQGDDEPAMIRIAATTEAWASAGAGRMATAITLGVGFAVD